MTHLMSLAHILAHICVSAGLLPVEYFKYFKVGIKVLGQQGIRILENRVKSYKGKR